MSPRTKQQFEEIREEKRSLIMGVALELFAENGYYNTSISKIATKAGISKGLIYNYFSSKEDLISKIITDGLDRISVLLDPNMDGIISREEMRSFIELYFDTMTSDSHFWRLYFSLMIQPRVLIIVDKKLKELIQVYINMIAKYFDMLGHEDPVTDAMIFAALLDGIGVGLIAAEDSYPVDKIKKRLIQLYCE